MGKGQRVKSIEQRAKSIEHRAEGIEHRAKGEELRTKQISENPFQFPPLAKGDKGGFERFECLKDFWSLLKASLKKDFRLLTHSLIPSQEGILSNSPLLRGAGGVFLARSLKNSLLLHRQLACITAITQARLPNATESSKRLLEFAKSAALRALSPLSFALCSKLYALRSLPYALSPLSFALCVIIIAGCGEEYPFEPQNSVPTIKVQQARIKTTGPLSKVMSDQDFPTADGCSWIYISPEDGHVYTAKINGTRNVNGTTARIMESDSEVPVDPIASLYSFPISASFFTKDMYSYTEHAFELRLDGLYETGSSENQVPNTYFQRNSPRRVLWSFPLYEGKEWIVWKSRTIPEITYSRRVISGDGIITVPAGTFKGVFYVEEYITIAGLQDEAGTPDKYWLAPDVGIIKYEYLDITSNTTRYYELTDFKKGG